MLVAPDRAAVASVVFVPGLPMLAMVAVSLFGGASTTTVSPMVMPFVEATLMLVAPGPKVSGFAGSAVGANSVVFAPGVPMLAIVSVSCSEPA